MPKKKNKKSVNEVSAHVHKKAKRKNIPTAELQDFVRDDETKPKKVLYPRDPSLDPQLVWKGKDEQDQKPLEVPSVPIYIQEKIHPQVLIEDLRLNGKGVQEQENPNLFADFNGIEFEELIDFYQHDQRWSNRLILGDSLLVMNSLAEKEGLKGKVQMIYIDPPYGIKFGSNWQVSTRKRDVKDGRVEDVTRQPEQIRAFRDTWELGIHSYLSYLRDRLVVARELLTETGSIFVQIGDENVHLVRCLLDEVFGSENFVSLITFKKSGSQTAGTMPSVCDYILWYSKNKTNIKFRQLYTEKKIGIDETEFNQVISSSGEYRTMNTEEKSSRFIPKGYKIFKSTDLNSRSGSESTSKSFSFKGIEYFPRSGAGWRTNLDGLKKLEQQNRLIATSNTLRYIHYFNDFPFSSLSNIWDDLMGSTDTIYVVQTNVKVIQRCLLMTTDPGDLVLDPTCGSGTTAFVAEQWGRRWITTDTSRVALALARTRIMSAKYPYYILSDTPEGIMKEAEVSKQLPANPMPKTEGDIKKGFVYKRVPHVTLKSIANDLPPDTEILFDQPYEDNKRIRVSGPFTVESLSPHRILSTDEERPQSEKAEEKTSGHGQFEIMILENLKKAGVQNTVKNERLKFDRLESFAGIYIQGEGEYTESGKPKRVAVSIGPEHGTVSPELVKEAAKEALKGVGFDLLIVCGFAFDPHANTVAKEFTPDPPHPNPLPPGEREKRSTDLIVSKEMRQYGKLTVLLARMNPDLAMGDELLKKTGSGNLFMVFGEPDITIKKTKDKMMTIELKGLDVYDPTTGQIRSHSTDDIACWFIDTDYNEESFFVRHAYFSGIGDPYKKLKRALRAEINESAWSTLYSTTSRPFPIPEKGKIAIKVINHYGDEVLKVYEVREK